jgi:predicted dehydrogenase
MESKQLKVGIAGYGVVGRRRQKFIDIHPNLETVAVCDQVFKSDGERVNGLRCYRDYKSLLQEPLDLLFVSLPNYLAPEVTITGLNSGMHVFCEKPPGLDVKDIEDVYQIKQKHPELQLKYGFNHRYHYSVQDALELINSKELGEIISLRGMYGKSNLVPFEGSWRSERKYAGGGILLDQGIHMVDLMRLFCEEFTQVKSFISNDFWKCDVEDNVFAIMRDELGRVAMLHSSATQWQHRFSLEISLSKGYIELRGILSGTKSYGQERMIVGRRKNSSTGSDSETITNYLNDDSWKNEIDEFADVILNQGQIQSGTVEDALATMKLVYKIYAADSDWSQRYNIADPDLSLL